MEFIESIFEITDKYEYFIIDLWGVVHDGIRTYPNVIEALTKLKNQNKKIIFVSNAPRRVGKVAKILEEVGVHEGLYDYILTSGEATHIYLEQNQNNNYKEFGKNYFYIGPAKDLDILDGLNYNMVDKYSGEMADFVVVTGYNDGSDIGQEAQELKKYVENGLTVICINPDKVVVRSTGEEILCAGVIADNYREIGGNVKYFGKPYHEIYDIALDILETQDKSKILAIGDGHETDIRGANEQGIDCAFVAGGIMSRTLGVRYGEFPDADRLKSLCKDCDIKIDYIIKGLH